MIVKLIKRYKTFKNKYVVQERRKYEYIVNRYYAHMIDPFFTKLVYDLGLSPNMVTIISCFTGICSGLAFFYNYWILGAFLLQLHHFLDGADGNLARLTGKCTPFGAKLDKISDQVVRFVVFIAVATVVNTPVWAKVLFMITIYLDLAIVHFFVAPFTKQNSLIRSRWKEWFLEKGIIPGFDIFTVFFLISVFSVIGRLETVVYLVIIFKNLDWLYRVWECWRTSRIQLGRARLYK